MMLRCLLLLCPLVLGYCTCTCTDTASYSLVSCFSGVYDVAVVYGTEVSALSAWLPLTSLLRALVRLQFQKRRVDMTRTWRNSDGEYDWYEF